MNHRIDQSGRTNDLLDDLLGMLIFVWAGCRRNVDRLVNMLREFVEHQRAIIQRRRQTKAKINQRLLARTVAIEHPANLRHRNVRFVHHQQKIIGKIIQQRPRRLAFTAPIHVAAVVFDAGTIAKLLHNFQVVHRALFEPRRFQNFALAFQVG